MLKTIMKLGLVGILAVTLLGMTTGCSMDPPEDGVQVKVTNKLSETQTKTLLETLSGYDSGITSKTTMTVNEKVTYNLSPVADVKAFADKITCGTVEGIEGRVITITAN